MTDSLTRVEITGTSPGTEALRIAGRPLPFTAATLELDAAHWPVLTVSLPVVDGLVVTLDTRLRLAEETHAALVAMGWTPPPSAADEAEVLHAEHHPGTFVPSLDSCPEHDRADYESRVRRP